MHTPTCQCVICKAGIRDDSIPARTEFRAAAEVGGRSFEVRWVARSGVPRSSVANVWGDLVARLLSEQPDAKDIQLTRDGD